MQTWVLPESDDAILASCETFRMRSVVNVGGAADEGVTIGIASVFVEEHLRRRGYAREMLSQVFGSPLHPQRYG